jgi:hypothetical protein
MDHVFIFILRGAFKGVGHFVEEGFPDGGGDKLQDTNQLGLALVLPFSEG